MSSGNPSDGTPDTGHKEKKSVSAVDTERLKTWKEALKRDEERDHLINKHAWDHLGK